MEKKENEFRKEAIHLALTSSQSIAKTARDLGIKESTLYSWISSEKDKTLVTSGEEGNEMNLVEELNRLRKENARLKEEREILKKATAFFAKEAK